MKKIIALFLMVALLLPVLCGCQKSTDTLMPVSRPSFFSWLK